MLIKTITSIIKHNNKYLFSTEVSQGISPLKLQLIKQSLPHVHKYGWSDNAIHAACA